jgi:hypothetical protein
MTSTQPDVLREVTESTPSHSKRQLSWTRGYDAVPTPQSRTPELIESTPDDDGSDFDVPIQPPSYWQAYDLFRERSFQQQIEQLGTFKTPDPLTVSSPSKTPPTVQVNPASNAETLKQEVKPRRTLSLMNRVSPYLSRIKSIAQKRTGT